MISISDPELWARLDAAGLTTGEMPETEDAHTPWFVRTMLGIAGLIAAAFLLGFVAAAFAFVVRSETASVAVGLMIIVAAYAVFRVARSNDFTIMFALAMSFAGQVLLIFGLFGWFGHASTAEPPWLVIAFVEACLAVVMPNFIHRAASAYGAGVAFAFACSSWGEEAIVAGTIAAAVAGIWLNEAQLGRFHRIAGPVGYGLTLSLVQFEAGPLLGSSTAMLFGSRFAPVAAPWIGEALLLAALLISVWVLLTRAGWSMREPRVYLALAAAAAIGATSFKAPGIACGLMIALLGFSNGNRILTGVGIAALLFYVSTYYFRLNETLLFKSGVLLATGALLLVVRWLLLNVILHEDVDVSNVHVSKAEVPDA
jgi:hypothetical protein